MSKNLRFRFAASALLFAGAAGAATLPLPLQGKRFTPHYLGFSDSGDKICLAGSEFDADAGTSSGQLLLIDRVHNTVLWQQRIAAPDGSAAIYPRGCVFHGGAVYLAANVNTQAARSLNQTMAYLYRFDSQGRQTGHKAIELPGRNQFAYALGDTLDGVKVAGYIKDEDEGHEYYSLFVASFDDALKAGAPSIRKNGAFDHRASARLIGDSLYIGGNFLPYKLSKQDLPKDYSSSRLRLAGSYVWSVRPQVAAWSEVSTGVGANGSVYALGYQAGKKSSMLAVVGPDGKAMGAFSYPSSYCETESLSASGSMLLAARKPCTGKGKAALLLIDLVGHSEEVFSPLQDEALFVGLHGGHWFAVARDGAGKLSLQSGVLQEPY
ncbi:hypothetical protein HSX11_22580 [Oxalobacteraceae bacterium]|nr:hypothetical protein [Oxalobacteraceae bacterium]